jgi:hypothetical protein
VMAQHPHKKACLVHTAPGLTNVWWTASWHVLTNYKTCCGLATQKGFSFMNSSEQKIGDAEPDPGFEMCLRNSVCVGTFIIQFIGIHK